MGSLPSGLTARRGLQCALVRRASLALLAAVVALSGAPLASCGQHDATAPGPAADASSDATPAPVLRTDPNAVHVIGTTFRDTQGRQLLFRGYNAKTAPLFDVTFTDGRVPQQTFPDLTEAQAARVEQLGFNVLRIALNWSSLEPQPLQYSAAWMQSLDGVLAMAHRHAFYVILDMHQDAYSKEIGLDGQPLWAIVPPPTQLMQGPFDGSSTTSGQVLNAGFSFFDDALATDGRDLQGAYVAAVQQMVQHVLGDPAVLGYEAYNEPVVLHQDLLDAFHQTFAAGVHAIDADAPVLFEPVSTRNETDDAVIPSTPWSSGPGAYA